MGMKIGVNGRLLVSEKMEGISRYIYETTCAMAKQHPDDVFYFYLDRSAGKRLSFPPNVRTVVVPWHARHPVLWYWWFEVMLPFYFWLHDIDVFYSGETYLSCRSRIPVVMVVHDLAYLHYPQHIPDTSLVYFKSNTPRFLKRADSLIAVSGYVRDDISRQFGIAPSRILIAGNAVNKPLAEYDTSLNPTEPYFLYVGALQPRKNIVNLIKAFLKFNKVHNHSFRLVLAGRMAWKTHEIKQTAEQHPEVILTGQVTESQKYGLISGAGGVAYVSFFEGFGIPILEAMAVGTPVITSSVTSMPEVAGDAALLADPHNIDEISAAMEILATDEQKRAELITKGYSRCKAYNWKDSADVIYSEIIRLKAQNAHK